MTRRAAPTPPRPAAASCPGGRLARFRHDEDGSFFVFGMILFSLMVMIGGIAVDVMRYEQRRVALQQTLDRSVLAAASLTQDLDPVVVVDDHMEKAELREHLDRVTVTEGLNFRNVNAEAESDLRNFFMHMVGVPEFAVPALSEAEQRINNVEIWLVLDVSGSMGGASGGSTKIANLRNAAREFVTTVKARDDDNRISIGIVPYNAQVNMPEWLAAKFNATHNNGHPLVNCLEMTSAQFNTQVLSRTAGMPMMSWADPNNSTTTSHSYLHHDNSNATPALSSTFCLPQDENFITMPTGDIPTLHTAIDGLTAQGNTSIVLGMKWAVTLIDPAMRPLYNELIGEGRMSADYAPRPFAYNDEDAMKVIVLMTDGEHVQHNFVRNTYKTGLAPIWRASDGNYSIRHTSGRPAVAGSNEYYVPHTNTWRSSPYGSGATQMLWQNLWPEQRVSWVAWQLYARALGTSDSTRSSLYDTWRNNFRTNWLSVSQMNTALQQACTQVKNNRTIVYGIAFEAPSNGQTQIRNCASSPAHYFNAQGLDIQTAFRAIASNISQLRLTQ
jgi:hypothetical protein